MKAKRNQEISEEKQFLLEEKIQKLKNKLESAQRTKEYYQKQLRLARPVTAQLGSGSFTWVKADHSCGLVYAGHIDIGWDESEELFYEEVLEYMRKGSFTREEYPDNSITKKAGLVVLSDTLGNEGWADYPDDNSFDDVSVYHMMRTPLAREWIKEGIIQVGGIAYNPNSSHPIRTFVLRTVHGDASFYNFEEETGFSVEELL